MKPYVAKHVDLAVSTFVVSELNGIGAGSRSKWGVGALTWHRKGQRVVKYGARVSLREYIFCVLVVK